MDREALDRLSHEELLELLAQQAEVIGRQQDELAEREAAIERRDEKIRALEEELAQFRQPAKTPENSSLPPSRGQKANRVAGRRRKSGPKRGHVGVSRLRSEPDVVIECRPGLAHPLHVSANPAAPAVGPAAPSSRTRRHSPAPLRHPPP